MMRSFQSASTDLYNPMSYIALNSSRERYQASKALLVSQLLVIFMMCV